jgi:hypothetical protein
MAILLGPCLVVTADKIPTLPQFHRLLNHPLDKKKGNVQALLCLHRMAAARTTADGNLFAALKQQGSTGTGGDAAMS